MKAVVFHKFGKPEVLSYEDVTTPDPKSDHVLVKVNASGVNYYDTILRAGNVLNKMNFPHIPGSDVAGTVEKVGENVEEFKFTDKVVVVPGYPGNPEEWDIKPENLASSYLPTGTYAWGGYAQYMEVHKRFLLHDTTGIPHEKLAAMPLVLVTAVGTVKTKANVQPGQKVLIHAGASGSGTMAIQVAKALGAQVATTVSNDVKAAVAKGAGADLVINYREQDFVTETKKWTNDKGVHAVIDGVGGETLTKSINVLRRGGIIVNYGIVGGNEARILNLFEFLVNQYRIEGSIMGGTAELQFGLDLVKQGNIQPMIGETLPLSQAQKAHEMIENHTSKGNIVLLPWE